MQTARLWRFVLLQREEGCWDLTDSLAFALEAHEGRPPPKQKKERKGFQALVTLFVGDGDLDDNLDDAADDYMSSDDGAHAGALRLCFSYFTAPIRIAARRCGRGGAAAAARGQAL